MGVGSSPRRGKAGMGWAPSLSGGRLRWGWVVLQRMPDGFLDRLKLIQDLIIPKTHDSEPSHFQRTRSPLIADGSQRGPMLTTINFDNQPCLQTYEVENVAFEPMLSPEFVPRHLSLTQG